MGLSHDEAMGKVSRMAELRDAKDELDLKSSALAKEINEINKEVTDYFITNEIQNLNVAGKLFYLHNTSLPNVTDPEGLHKWLQERDALEAMMSFNSSKFRAYYRELDETNQELPPMVETYIKSEVRVRKG